MDFSIFLEIKQYLLTALPFKREAFHILIGLSAHLTACLIAGRPLYWIGGLFAALAAGIILEIPDIMGAIQKAGSWREINAWRLQDSFIDLVHTLVAPAITVLMARLIRIRRRRRS